METKSASERAVNVTAPYGVYKCKLSYINTSSAGEKTRLFHTPFLLQTVSTHQLYKRISALSSARKTPPHSGHFTVTEEQEQHHKSILKLIKYTITISPSESRLTHDFSFRLHATLHTWDLTLVWSNWRGLMELYFFSSVTGFLYMFLDKSESETTSVSLSEMLNNRVCFSGGRSVIVKYSYVSFNIQMAVIKSGLVTRVWQLLFHVPLTYWHYRTMNPFTGKYKRDIGVYS